MKKLLLTWVITFLMIGLAFAQTNNTHVQTFTPEEDCYFAVFALNGPTVVETWEEPTIKITYTLKTEKDIEATIEQNAMLQQIEMQFFEEERVMIFELPDQEGEVLTNAKMVIEFLEIEILIPNGIKYHVVPMNLHPLL